MLSSSWSVRLPHPPEGELARPIDLNGESWCLVYQAAGKRLFVHEKNISRPFPFQKEATCLEVYRHQETPAVAVLCNNILSSYDLVNNRQFFSLEVEAASLLEASKQHLYVAGLASLHCVDLSGKELWNTHLSGNVICMKASADGYLFLGLDDRSIKIFLKDQMLNDYSNLAAVPACFCQIDKSAVMVGFKQGLVAVYESKKPKWKAKSKHVPKQILLHRVETQKDKTAIVAREDGQIEMRSWIDGTIFSKFATQEPICRMFVLDFRKEGQQQLVVVSRSGTMKGFNMLEKLELPKVMIGAEKDQLLEAVASLKNTKTDLEMEIEQLKRQLEKPAEASAEILRNDFDVSWKLDYKQKFQLKVSCKNGMARGIIFEEGLSPFYQRPAQKLVYDFDGNCEYFGKVHAQLLVSSYPSNEYELRPIDFELKRFWKWLLIAEPTVVPPESSVTFKHPERVARYAKWLDQCFHLGLTEQQFERLQQQYKLQMSFRNSFDKSLLVIRVDSATSTASFHCENLQLLSQMVQDIAEYMNIKELEVDGKFPKETAQLRQKLSQVEQLSKNKASISSEIADAINGIKSMVVRGENARMLCRMGDVRRTYTQIMEENHKLCLEIEKRSRNAATLNELLRYTGQMITMAAGMRVGTARNRVNTLCRNALKNKHFLSIADIMEKGYQ